MASQRDRLHKENEELDSAISHNQALQRELQDRIEEARSIIASSKAQKQKNSKLLRELHGRDDFERFVNMPVNDPSEWAKFYKAYADVDVGATVHSVCKCLAKRPENEITQHDFALERTFFVLPEEDMRRILAWAAQFDKEEAGSGISVAAIATTTPIPSPYNWPPHIEFTWKWDRWDKEGRRLDQKLDATFKALNIADVAFVRVGYTRTLNLARSSCVCGPRDYLPFLNKLRDPKHYVHQCASPPQPSSEK
jgi:hypothetical protein